MSEPNTAPAPEAAPPTPPADTTGTVFTPPVEGSPLGGATSGTDTNTGTDTTTGADSNSGADSNAGDGNDSISGDDPGDVVPLASTDLVVPDGLTVSDAEMGEFLEFANGSKLSKEAAQSALDLYTKNLQANVAALVEGQRNAWNETITGWKADLAKDPEFSGDNMVVAQTTIGRALDEYGDQATRDAFELTGAGWNPAIIRFVHNMAKALSEGKPVAAAAPAQQTGPKTPGQALYGKQE